MVVVITKLPLFLAEMYGVNPANPALVACNMIVEVVVVFTFVIIVVVPAVAAPLPLNKLSPSIMSTFKLVTLVVEVMVSGAVPMALVMTTGSLKVFVPVNVWLLDNIGTLLTSLDENTITDGSAILYN